jgi:hypothetical protein
MAGMIDRDLTGDGCMLYEEPINMLGASYNRFRAEVVPQHSPLVGVGLLLIAGALLTVCLRANPRKRR